MQGIPVWRGYRVENQNYLIWDIMLRKNDKISETIDVLISMQVPAGIWNICSL
jgi:hypothetical protein